MQTHDLKIWPEHFRAVASGEKTVELRTDDRGYEVGDELLLREYDPDTASYIFYMKMLTGKGISSD